MEVNEEIFNMPKIIIVNVGVNASHGTLMSPIFTDNTFKFIPIPEDKYPTHDLPTYKEIFPQYLRYIPQNFHNFRVHNDPEFSTYTYGDYPDRPRVANLKHILKGDWLFFLARLVRWQDGRFTNDAGFYLIGYFEIKYVLKGADVENILRNSSVSPQSYLPLDDIKNNAHIIRTVRGNIPQDSFWIFKGNGKSRLFKYAVPFVREFTDKVMRDRNGNPWFWDKQKSPLQVIGSYTRSARIIQREDLVRCFWEWIDSHANS